MRRALTFIIIIAAAASLASCSKLLEPLYIHLPGTEWVYELNGKRAYIHFDLDGTACVLQKDLATGAIQENHGTYSCDGHRATISCEDGTAFNLIRTFTNLKNSKNKDMGRLTVQKPSQREQSVWVGVNDGDLYVYYFPNEDQLTLASFVVTKYEEGVPMSWEVKDMPFTAGNYIWTVDGNTAWLFSDIMLLDNRWHVTFPEPEGSGNSDLVGSIWYYMGGTSTSPGLLIFDTGHSFSRVQIYSGTQMIFDRGVYALNGDTLTMTLNGKSDNCTISGENTFHFMERTYKRLN